MGEKHYTNSKTLLFQFLLKLPLPDGFDFQDSHAYDELVKRLIRYDKLAGLVPELVEPIRQPAKIGGGVVMKCKQCNGTWWLDEPDEIHLDPTCPAVKARKFLEEEL